jgi:hypothetical protein
MIQGYPAQVSILPGETLTLHVSTDQPRFRVEFYRQGQTLEPKAHPASQTWQIGQNVPKRASNDAWNWPGYEYAIPKDWPTGAYIVMFYEGDQDSKQISAPLNPDSADGRDAKALFVVKNPAPGSTARILYKLALFTYHAYNAEGDPWGSLYQPKVYKTVTLLRPGGGTGGSPNDTFAPDYYDQSSPRQVFAHWDVPFIQWLESNSYAVDYCTDYDVHLDGNFLDSYSLLLSVGHDEYWSETLRTHLEKAISRGLNVGIFSGNTCFRRVTFEGDAIFGHRIEWYKLRHPEQRGNWAENLITGVSYRNGGGRWTEQREPIGYTIQYADHWIYEGTGLNNGDVFGKQQCLVGYEFDGAKLVNKQGLFVASGKDGTPESYIVLGIGRITPKGSSEFPRWTNNWAEAEIYGEHTATMGLYTNTGIVFNAATTDWARVLANREQAVERITRNVLNRLQARGVRVSMEGMADPVAGQTVTFRIDTASLAGHQNLRSQWTISRGEATALDQPSLQVRMPDPLVPITITVTVTDSAGRQGFGTLTISPGKQSPESGLGGLLNKLRSLFNLG